MVDRERNLAAFNPVRDAKGKPKVFYHGTDADFNEFYPMSHFGTAKAANDRNRKGQTYAVHLSVNNPLQVTDAEASDEAALLNSLKRGKYPHIDLNTASHYGVAKALSDAGHDGLTYKNLHEDIGHTSYVPLYPHQIKSATGNNGNFDPHNPDITKGDGGPITAYHGSPHDFEQFDTSKIGTGEGAQSYGHGLYFAEAEPVARNYRDQLSDTIGYTTKSGIPLRESKNFGEFGSWVNSMHKNGKSPEEIAEILSNSASSYLSSRFKSDYPKGKNLTKLAEGILSGDISHQTSGHMYEVAIDAHPDHMLDWDEPLSKQPHITSKVMTPELIDQINRYRAGWKLGDVKPDFSNFTGEDLYAHLSQPVSGQKGNDKAASEHLSSLGVHGIRYLDALSRRHDKNATHNYVVFDHNRVKVNRKYEQGGAVEGYGDGGTTHEPHKRAEEQGYSIKGYHFTRGPKAQSIAKSKQFDPYLSEGGENATFFWDNPQAANDWAHFAGGVDPSKPQEKMTPSELDRLSRFAPSMLPVRIHPGKHTVVNWPEAVGFHHYASHAMRKLIQNARSEGYDTIRIKNMREGDVEDELEKYPETPHDQIAVLNPNVIRSEFAQFDPARQHENDIGARKGGTINREKVDYKNATHSPIVEHVLGKISAPLPALNPHLTAAIAGRRS